MKTLIGILCTCAMMIAFGQTDGGPKPASLIYVLQTRPQALPGTMTDVVRTDAYVCYADIIGAGQTVTIQDRQSTPVAWINGVIGASGAPVMWPFVAHDDTRCRWFPNGVSWRATGGTGSATGYLTIKCSKQCSLFSGQ